MLGRALRLSSSGGGVPTHLLPRYSAHQQLPTPLWFLAQPPAETKGIPLEDTAYACLFARHPVWRRVMGKAGRQVLEREAFRAAAWRQAQGEEGGDLRDLARYYETLGL